MAMNNLKSEENMNEDCNPDDSEEQKERLHFQRILNAFKYYKAFNVSRRLHKSLRYIQTLPESHQECLKNYKYHLLKLKQAYELNYEVINIMMKDAGTIFENTDHTQDIDVHAAATLSDMDKLHSVLKQIVREWSLDGAQERKACFKPIVDEILHWFPDENDRENIRVLVPGAGLGRLPFEIAALGYSCQGNEFSLFMLFISNFILNKSKDINYYTLYPWVHQSCNNLTNSDQLKSIQFPDVDPKVINHPTEFSMVAGSFLEIYTVPDQWDCITTCFFLDTANNVVQYIETIYKILKPGGIWINIGPLLYHFADMPSEHSLEPSYEEVKNIIRQFGFKFMKEATNVDTPYSQNNNSMMLYQYRSVFFVCQKPLKLIKDTTPEP